MVAIIISIISSIISGMVLFFLQIFFKTKAKKDEENDKTKAKENYLILKSIDAVGKLPPQNARVLKCAFDINGGGAYNWFDWILGCFYYE